MLIAKYPIIGTEKYIIIRIEKPEIDPNSRQNEKRCKWEIVTPLFERSGYCYGIDDFQCVNLAFKTIESNKINFEHITKKKCEFFFTN
jgi:hypothetical protein